LQAECFFALGDTYLNAGQDGVPIATDPYGDAIIAYSRITNNFPTNRLAAVAMGAIGNCHLQRAEKLKDPKHLELAADAYLRAMSWPRAEAAARTLAEVALGVVREKQGRVKEAAENWGNVFYQKQLRPEETPDLRQVQEAGRQLARLREEQQDWAGAILIYQRMQQMFPSRRAALEQRVERARQMLSGPK
jgi:tetratricopeptide (TPR) repeat protein